MFKNAVVFKINEPVGNLDEIESLLTEHATREIGSMELRHLGWAPVIKDNLAESTEHGLFFRMAIKEKILPAAVVNDECAKEIARLEDEQQRVLSKKERATVKDEILVKLVQVALVKNSHIDGFLNDDFLVVDTSSAGKAEDFANLLRRTLGSLKAEPLSSSKPIEQTLTHWAINSDNVPKHLDRTGSYLIKLDEENKKVRMQGFVDGESLGAEAYAEAGGKVVEMSLTYSEKIDFSITDGFIFRKIDFGDIECDDDEEDPHLIKLAEMELTAGELTELIKQMVIEFSGDQQ